MRGDYLFNICGSEWALVYCRPNDIKLRRPDGAGGRAGETKQGTTKALSSCSFLNNKDITFLRQTLQTNFLIHKLVIQAWDIATPREFEKNQGQRKNIA